MRNINTTNPYLNIDPSKIQENNNQKSFKQGLRKPDLSQPLYAKVTGEFHYFDSNEIIIIDDIIDRRYLYQSSTHTTIFSSLHEQLGIDETKGTFVNILHGDSVNASEYICSQQSKTQKNIQSIQSMLYPSNNLLH